MSKAKWHQLKWVSGSMHAALATGLIFAVEFAFAKDMAVSVHLSPEGGGIEYTAPYSDKLHARFAYHQYTRSGTDISDLLVRATTFGVTSAYQHDAKQQVVSAIADYYYTDSRQSRVSLGLMHNKSDDNLIASESVLGGYTINNVYYPSNQVSKLTGTIKYNSVAPYIGLGWGNPLAPGKKWGLMFDIGVMYQGKPEVTLHATGAAATLNADIIAEQNSIRNQSSEWSLLTALGLFYRW